jgi:uncharacterized membrane protein YhaH (DUF805 family)
MKLPSLVRVPKYRRFNFEPRHYDPIKEELKNRTERIENELKSSKDVKMDEFAVRQRISEAFVRDRNKTGGNLGSTQLFFVALISASFVGFWYIGLPAFIITGVIIFLYILYQKGLLSFKKASNDDTSTIAKIDSPEPAASRITAGQMREGRYFTRNTSASKRGWYKLVLLLATVGVSVAYYVLQLNGFMSLLMIFILIILFIKESNKA